MKRSLMDILACPVDHGELELVVGREEEEIIEGELVCKVCGRRYPIVDSIPDLIPRS
jgi:uncharacterized protein YbaR (Trm112 family)